MSSCVPGGPGWNQVQGAAACTPRITQHASGWVTHTHSGIGAWGPDTPLGLLRGSGPWTLEGIRVVCGAGPQGGSWALRLGSYAFILPACAYNRGDILCSFCAVLLT